MSTGTPRHAASEIDRRGNGVRSMFKLRALQKFALAKDTVKSVKETQRRPLLVDYAAWTTKLSMEVWVSIRWRVSKSCNEIDACAESEPRVLFFISGSKGS